MARSSRQKQKLLYIHKWLHEYTDEEHKMSAPRLLEMLSEAGISADRKSIYSDIRELVDFGVDIMIKKGKDGGYYIASREFELPELQLLADAVASSRFITEKKSTELIRKITSLASKWQAGRINRQIFMTNRTKNANERIYYNIDSIHRAISENREINFLYFEYDTDKNKKYRREGERYEASPYTLYWDDEYYYMIAYYERYGMVVNFRVDKMEDIEITSQSRRGEASREDFDTVEYAKRLFSMFVGETQKVRLLFSNDLMGAALDRFGHESYIEKNGEEHFVISTEVSVSPAFLGWLFQFGEGVKVLSPQSLRDSLKKRAQRILEQYENENDFAR